MGYYINLASISLKSFKEKLKSADLLPSRMFLKDSIDSRFEVFIELGIRNVEELQKELKKKPSFEKLAACECFTEEYLSVLLREINSIHPKPNKLEDFLGLSTEVVTKLKSIGIKDTVSLFEKVKSPADRNKLAHQLKIETAVILELTKLADLSRIKWVGATFARVLYETGCDTVEKVANADFPDLHQKIVNLNAEKKLFKGNIGLNDIKLCVAAAKDVPLEIEY